MKKERCPVKVKVKTNNTYDFYVQCRKSEGHKGCCGTYITLTPPQEKDEEVSER